MALPVRKGYKGSPAQAVLTNSPASGDTSFVVDTVTGWATTFPFYCVVEPGTSKEEKVKVTAISTLTLTVVRAQDDTTAQAHDSGAAIYPVFTADEADEANEIASVMTTKGDLIATNGSSINRLGVGTNTHVLQADSTATNGFKWGQVVEAGIADSAVTSAKILDGTIVNADINASAAIALSKLATGALPTAITVASANIVDGTIVNDDINTSAGIVDTKLATIATAGKVSNSATTATSANTASAIVARDASGDFSANVINAVTNLGAGRGVGIQADPTNTSAILQFTNNAASSQLASLVATNGLITATTPITATSFNGPLTGNVTGNVTGSSGSCTGNAATATNVAYSGLTGAVPTWNQNTTGNAATATTASTVSNGSITAAKLSGISGLTSGVVGINPMSTAYTEYLVTIPNGRTYNDVVSVQGLEGVNDVVWVAGYALGNWSGVQSPTQLSVLARLGNGAASNLGYIRVWFSN